MTELTFRPSRVKAIGVAIGCAAGAVITWFALGEETTFSAMSKGGLLAKIGIANAIFMALTPLALLKAVLRPTTLKINTEGVSEISPLGRFECRWADVVRIDVLHLQGIAYVEIETRESTRRLTPGYGPRPKELAAILRRYQSQASQLAAVV